MSDHQTTNQIQGGPGVYTIIAKDIKTVQVQESDLVRLKDHLDSIHDFSNGRDYFSIILGACISEIINTIIQWNSTNTVPSGHIIITFLLMAASFVIYANRDKRLDIKEAQLYLDEARKDLTMIFDKANLEKGKNNGPTKNRNT